MTSWFSVCSVLRILNDKTSWEKSQSRKKIWHRACLSPGEELFNKLESQQTRRFRGNIWDFSAQIYFKSLLL